MDEKLREVYCDTCESPQGVGRSGSCPGCGTEIAVPRTGRLEQPPPRTEAFKPHLRTRPAAAAPATPQLAQFEQRTGLWSDYCAVCRDHMTHTRKGCTKCLGRADNRKQGILFAIIGVGLLALSIVGAAFASIFVAIPLFVIAIGMLGNSVPTSAGRAIMWLSIHLNEARIRAKCGLASALDRRWPCFVACASS